MTSGSDGVSETPRHYDLGHFDIEPIIDDTGHVTWGARFPSGVITRNGDSISFPATMCYDSNSGCIIPVTDSD